MSKAPEWVRVARVVRTHGLKGELTVELLGGAPGRLAPGMTLRGPEGELTLDSVRGQGTEVLLKVKGISGRDQASALTGSYLEVPAEAVRQLGPDEFFHFQLLGLEVADGSGARRGELVDIEAYPAHDVYVLLVDGGRCRVPAVRDAILEVDLARRRMVVATTYLEGVIDAL
ncbi:MAG: ribosome maturation factor RimM [Candidatus Dormibacteria bacterium]